MDGKAEHLRDSVGIRHQISGGIADYERTERTKTWLMLREDRYSSLSESSDHSIDLPIAVHEDGPDRTMEGPRNQNRIDKEKADDDLDNIVGERTTVTPDCDEKNDSSDSRGGRPMSNSMLVFSDGNQNDKKLNIQKRPCSVPANVANSADSTTISDPSVGLYHSPLKPILKVGGNGNGKDHKLSFGAEVAKPVNVVKPLRKRSRSMIDRMKNRKKIVWDEDNISCNEVECISFPKLAIDGSDDEIDKPIHGFPNVFQKRILFPIDSSVDSGAESTGAVKGSDNEDSSRPLGRRRLRRRHSLSRIEFVRADKEKKKEEGRDFKMRRSVDTSSSSESNADDVNRSRKRQITRAKSFTLGHTASSSSSEEIEEGKRAKIMKPSESVP